MVNLHRIWLDIKINVWTQILFLWFNWYFNKSVQTYIFLGMKDYLLCLYHLSLHTFGLCNVSGVKMEIIEPQWHGMHKCSPAMLTEKIKKNIVFFFKL